MVVGRRSELELLSSTAGAVVDDGRAKVVSVVAEAGLGKTTLLDVTAESLAGRGFMVMRCATNRTESALTWAGLHSLLAGVADGELQALVGPRRRALLAALGRVERRRRPDEPLDPTLVAFALAALVAARAAISPVAIVVDDLHWLDESSAGVIGFAVRAATDLPVLGLFASRPDPDPPLEIERVLGPDRTHVVELDGLSPAGLHHLLADRCGVSLARPDLIRLHELTGGNPLHALEAGRLIAGGTAVGEALRLPTVQRLMEERLREIDDQVVHALHVAALASEPTVSLLAEALPDVDVEAALARAERGGLLAVTGDAVRFTHPLLRAAARERVGGIEHRRLARALADVLPDPDEQVLLRASITFRPDEALATDLEEAGRRAALSGAVHLAIDRFRLAADRTPPVERELLGRRLWLAAEAADQAGDTRAAVELAGRALDHVVDDDDVRVAAAHTIVLARAHSGELEAAAATCRNLIDELGDRPAEQQRTFELLAQVLAFFDLRGAAESARIALDLAQSHGMTDRSDAAELLCARLGVLAGSSVDIERMRDLAVRAGGCDRRSRWLVEVLVWRDELDAAEALLQGAIRCAEEVGDVHLVSSLRHQWGDLLWRAGRWREAEPVIIEWIDHKRLISADSWTATAYADLAGLAAAGGRFVDAAELLVEARRHPYSAALDGVHFESKAGFVALAEGSWSAAADAGRLARTLAERVGYRDLGGAPFRADLIEALLQLGELDEAQEVAEEHVALAEQSESPRGRVEGHRSLGLVRAARGDLQAALVELEVAEAALEGFPVPFERARTQLTHGGLLRRAGRRSDAAARLSVARGTFAALGAAPWLARCDAELERLGRRARSGEGTDSSLTPTEQQVAALAAAGRTNAEIASALSVSVRTVESNLTRVYRKLGVRSRTELAAHLATPA